jgi:hypothetical protein
MRKKRDVRTRRLCIPLSPGEWEELSANFEKTVYFSKAEYLRTLLFQKPVRQYFRNKSLDEFIVLAVGFKNEFGKMNGQFGETLKLLQSASRGGTEFKETLDALIAEESAFRAAMEEIRQMLIKIHETCS